MIRGKLIERIVDFASGSDVFVVGELHGTREIPALCASLLGPLRDQGFKAIAIEAPSVQRTRIRSYARGETSVVPWFYSHPYPDGRGSEEQLRLVRTAMGEGWELLCIDGPIRNSPWTRDPQILGARRDEAMARTLLDQIDGLQVQGKILCITGNVHSRVEQDSSFAWAPWPSFAAKLAALSPELKVLTMNIVFHSGRYSSSGMNRIRGLPLFRPRLSLRPTRGHSAELHLPTATSAHFLGPFVDLDGRESKPANEELMRELLAMEARDQEAIASGVDEAERRKTLDTNTARMKEIVGEFGWPTRSLVGRMGSSAAWLLVQHSDRDREFQRKCLELIEPHVHTREVRPSEFAYLTDRVLVGNNEPQVYGTQFRHGENGIEPLPIADAENVDQRRAEVGLEPLDYYLDAANSMQ